jgi:two-component system response regulator BaeR
MTSTSDKTVLIVEDETPLAQVLEEYLRASALGVERIEDGLAVVPRVREAPPDLILLDLMLPGRDGLEICRELRTFSSVPIIMVTARVEEIDRLLGLELGADDYVCKPFAPREVVARVKAQLRRVEMLSRPPGEADAMDGLVLDEDRYEASLDGRKLRLTVGEFRLLSALCRRPGRILSRASLIDALYDDHRVVTERSVDTHVKNLRRKLASAFDGRQFIESVYGVGYRYEPE